MTGLGVEGNVAVPLERLLDTIPRSRQQIEKRLEYFEKALRSVDPFILPVELGTAIARSMIEGTLATIAWARGEVAGWWSRVVPFFTQVGDPGQLRDIAFGWQRQVEAPVRKCAGWFDENKMRIDDEWTDDASHAYVRLLPAQKEALLSVAGMSKGVSDALMKFARAIEVFWTSIAAAFGRAVVEIGGVSLGIIVVNAGERLGEIIRALAEALEKAFEAFRMAALDHKDTTHELVSNTIGLEAFAPRTPSGECAWPTLEGLEPIRIENGQVPPWRDQ